MDSECKNIIEIAEGPSVCAPEEESVKSESSGLDVSAYYIKVTIDKSFDDVISTVKELIEGEGFSVINEIDLQSIFKNKLGIDYSRYTVIGVCNLDFVHKALGVDINIGLLMPCKIAVYEQADNVVAAALDPVAQVSICGEPGLQEFAIPVKEKLINILKQL